MCMRLHRSQRLLRRLAPRAAPGPRELLTQFLSPELPVRPKEVTSTPSAASPQVLPPQPLTSTRPRPIAGTRLLPCPPLATGLARSVMGPTITCCEGSTRAGSQRLPSGATTRPPTPTILLCLPTPYP